MKYVCQQARGELEGSAQSKISQYWSVSIMIVLRGGDECTYAVAEELFKTAVGGR